MNTPNRFQPVIGSRVKLVFSLLLGALSATTAFSLALNKEKVTAQTLSPLRASMNKNGDRFTLLVLSPEPLKNAVIEGEVSEASSSAKADDGSNLSFKFYKLALPDGSIFSIQASLLQIVNSKGENGIDDDGNRIDQKSVSEEEGEKGQKSGGGNRFSRLGKTVARGAKGLAQKIAGGVTIAFHSSQKDIHFESGASFTLLVSTVESKEKPITSPNAKKPIKTIESP